MITVPSGLLLITDRTQAILPLTEICDAALDAGFVGIMVREKDLPGGPLHAIASPIAELCRNRGRICLINDRLDVALALPGSGAHVGKEGVPVQDARRLLGPDRPLGYSAHEPGEAGKAIAAGADYVTLSPVFHSHSKPALKPRSPAWLSRAIDGLPPGRVFALGGVGVENVGEIRNAGAVGAAIMGEMMRARDPGRVALALVEAWG